jgi:hypothetical protein
MFAPNRDPFAEPLHQESAEPVAAQEPSRTAGLAEALGERYLMFDPTASATFEVLEFRQEFSTPAFEAALRERVDHFFPLNVLSLETGYTVERRNGALMLVSKQLSGRRLSELLERAHGAGFALALIRLVTPVLAAISRTGDNLSHGLLSADRIILARDGRLVVVEPVLGSAVATLSRSRNQLIEMGLAIPATKPGEPIAFDGRSDLTQLGFLALSLLLGRRLDPGDYPDKISGLLDEFVIHAESPMLAAKLRTWLERAMQLSQRAFTTAADAEAALVDLPEELDARAGAAMTATPPATTVVSFKKEREKEKPVPAPADTTPAVPAARKAEHEHATAPAPKATKPVVSIAIGDPAPTKGEPPARKRGGWSRWVIAALVLIALGQGAVIYLQPYLRPAADVIEIRPQAVAPVAPAPLPPPPVNADGTPATALSAQLPAGASSQPAPGGPLTSGVAPAAAVTTGALAKPQAPTTALNAPAGPATPPPANQTSLAAIGGAATAEPGAAARFGGLTVTSRIDLQVFEGGKALGSTAAPLALAEGAHNLELVNETLGFRHTQSVTVRGGRMLTLNIDVPKGRLSINALPWADVDINGVAAGQTPLANVSLPIGTHQITFRHPELGTRTQTVVVKVDGSAKVTQTFKPGGDR